MPGYIERALHRFQHPSPKKPQHSPHAWTAPNYSAATQAAIAEDTTSPLGAADITFLQQIIGTLLYYARAVDNTMLVAISTLASVQAKGTEATMDAAVHLLNYCATLPDAVFRFSASDMILHIHSDASYLSVHGGRSRLGGYFYLSQQPPVSGYKATSKPPPFNGPVLVHSTIMPQVLSSADEAEFGALFYNAKDGETLRTTLNALGHLQPATPIQTDNACAAGIVNNTVRQRRSRAMDMHFYWIKDRVQQGHFTVYWKSGADNQVDYFTKHHSPSHHRVSRPIFLHIPSATALYMQGCVDPPPYTNDSSSSRDSWNSPSALRTHVQVPAVWPVSF
jgi:hypothetical protein